MTLGELMAVFRSFVGDPSKPFIFEDELVKMWLNEAQDEACARALLIHDVSTTAVCQISVTAGTSVYPLHASILDITRVGFTPTGSTQEQELYLTDLVELDRIYPGWRKVSDTPRYAIQKDTTLRLACTPKENGLLELECHRLPLVNIEDQTDGAPEIGQIHHRHLVQWVLHRCYSYPDAELFDANKSETALAEFTRVFGLRLSATARRSSQANRPHFNKAIW